jgi:hypothetical protein
VLDDLMILDCGHTVFVWEGPQASKTEKKDTLEFMKDFCKNHPGTAFSRTQLKLVDGRSKEVPEWWSKHVYVTKSKQEPLEFSSCFFGWEVTKWKPTPYDALVSLVDALAQYRLFRNVVINLCLVEPTHLKSW